MGLNQKQKEAVEYLDGPLLVLAGPGTGKTQLLSEKVIYILKNTDTAPENILCLTFTESGAQNMRERLKSLIGTEAHKVNIGTYHAFGQDVLARYKNFSPDYERMLDTAIDEVAQYKIIKELQTKLPPRDILLGDKVKDIISTISSAKAAGLDAAALKKVAEQNIEDSLVIAEAISPLLLNVVPRVFKASYENAYSPIYEVLKDYEHLPPIVGRIERSIVGMARDLKIAINEALDMGKIKPLSKWKDDYFEKDGKGGYRLTDRVANKKLLSLSTIMSGYEKYLSDNCLYDFDDMIIEAVKVLSSDVAFKQTMQEKYQYIMLDEFQDTNPVQLSIIKELTDYEKPMVMAVGDDDQAIYEFQGATPTNLSDFRDYYSAHVVTLTENYRSSQEILDFSRQVINQAPNRFASEKSLTAHVEAPSKSQIHRIEFLSSDQEYEFIASKISELVQSGVKQSDIAIISSKHKYFQPLLPYLKEHPEIKIAYERRDNLLEDKWVHEMINVMRLALEISRGERITVPLLEVLTYSWLNVSTREVIKMVGEARENHKPVFDYLLNAKPSDELRAAIDYFLDLSTKVHDTPLETLMNEFAQKIKVETFEAFEMFRFYENMASLRAKVMKYVGERPLRLVDLVQMADDYTEASMQLSTSSPYRDAADAVQILSAHKAKGLEFSYVFVISTDHTAWGKGKGNNNFLALPANLIQIRHTGTTDGEQIRLLYVALPRAKHTLFITNSVTDFSGKSPERLEYLDERVEKLENGKSQIISPFLPSLKVLLSYNDNGFSETIEESADGFSASKRSAKRLKDYLSPFLLSTPDIREIYKNRIMGYRMSASSLTSFIDIMNAGPIDFFKKTILRAESEPENEILARGNLVHLTFEQVTNSGMSDEAAVEFYLSELDKRDIDIEVKSRIRETGPEELLDALKAFSDILRRGKAEVDFSFEHLNYNGVPITGKIDHIITDEETKTIEIYDFKTSKFRKDRFSSHPTLFKYMLQLQFYKMLLNLSPVYSKYQVNRAHILFVRPDEDGEVYDKIYEFNQEDEKNFYRLLEAVYFQIVDLKFLDDTDVFIPAKHEYGMKEIKEFISLLLAKNG